MLFNSYTFILAFLPATFCGYHGLRQIGLDRAAVGFLGLASLFFYGWWNPFYLVLLIALILANFVLARRLVLLAVERRTARRAVLAIGIVGNLAVLGYFKYANFLVTNIDHLRGVHAAIATVVLPLGISFFTFQKIALLVDAYGRKIQALSFLDFLLFVSFFPQLIAGPIVHHSEVVPQFGRRGRVASDTIALGAAIFTIGLCKKVLLADPLAHCVAPPFDAAAAGDLPTAAAAWTGALAYTLQLYFDFSGYSDMAAGSALLLGVRLPLNFASPYKAENIIDFWRRWHMTLSRFLRDYLYIPLGGNRRGSRRRYLNLLITMLLGGLWHGAGWTFVLWGGLHGLYLAVNHGWRGLRARTGGFFGQSSPAGCAAARAITFIAVVVAWVLFRADDLPAAVTMLKAMAGANGLGSLAVHGSSWQLIAPLLAVVWVAPNTQQITGYIPPNAIAVPFDPALPAPLAWRPSPGRAILCGGLFAVALLSLSHVSEFLYFQF
ncbi:MAG: MBOAT family protein [Alphaproteobacteria bacterium]|nr:MBOAT family protein [Alphaproteobacteria bacterium]